MHKQLTVLFVCGLCMSIIGSGITPLLPLYALAHGAPSETVGVMMATAYVALACGIGVAHHIAARIGSHKYALVAVGLLSSPMLGLLGQTSGIWQFAALLIGAWFCGGVAGALISIAVGLAANAGQRGRVFGMLWLREPLGMLIGGATLGLAAERLGYELAFVLAGALALLWPLLGAMGLHNTSASGGNRELPAMTQRAQQPLPDAFLFLLAATVLATTPMFVGRLGIALSMQSLGFSPGAISSTVLVGGIATVPLLPLLSLLADRWGVKQVTLVAYGLAVTGMVLLASATQLWQFWAAGALLTVASNTSGAMAAAWGADLLPQAALARGLTMLSALSWTAAMVGSAVTGYGLTSIGAPTLYLVGAGMALGALVFLGRSTGVARAYAQG